MLPFWKAAGSNEIDVVESSDSRGTRCWMYGSESGQGYAMAATWHQAVDWFGMTGSANWLYEVLAQA